MQQKNLGVGWVENNNSEESLNICLQTAWNLFSVIPIDEYQTVLPMDEYETEAGEENADRNAHEIEAGTQHLNRVLAEIYSDGEEISSEEFLFPEDECEDEHLNENQTNSVSTQLSAINSTFAPDSTSAQAPDSCQTPALISTSSQAPDSAQTLTLSSILNQTPALNSSST